MSYEKEQAIIIALVRCVLADKPNDAVCHQINRLLECYIDNDNKEMADRLFEILNPAGTEQQFRIVQS